MVVADLVQAVVVTVVEFCEGSETYVLLCVEACKWEVALAEHSTHFRKYIRCFV